MEPEIENVNTLKPFNFHNSTTAYLRWPWSNNGEIHLTFVFNFKVWQKSRFHVRTLACIQTQAVVFSLPQDIWPMMISTPLNDVNITIYHPFRYIPRRGYRFAHIHFGCFCRSGDQWAFHSISVTWFWVVFSNEVTKMLRNSFFYFFKVHICILRRPQILAKSPL